MFKRIAAKIKPEVSGQSAYSYVADISRFHRIQASPGFRQAAEHCNSALLALGIDSRIQAYIADGAAQYWSCKSWEEWECRSARLTLISPREEVLADFQDCPISLIQRSSSTHAGGVEAQVVVVNQGERTESYSGLDLLGKIVLAQGDVSKIRRHAQERGAIGMVTDNMSEWLPVRARVDIPDARQYTSFWLRPDDPPFFGFVLSPRQGDSLRKLLEHNPGSVTVRAFVDARFYPGRYEVVDAVIPGETDEEVWGIAHLCHPKPSANDNASGCGALMEAARALSYLIGCGVIEKPRRTIRFLFVPEMTGTYCYLAENESVIPKVVAGVNLDMVGENQHLCGGPLIVEKPPRSIGSYTGELLSAIMEEVCATAQNLAGTSKYSLIKQATTPFSGGSDHYILSDPSVGIPCPMVIQWPDKYYHTSEDTIDKVDPAMLGRVASAVASYLYFLADSGLAEALYVANMLVGDFHKEINSVIISGFEQVALEARRAPGHNSEPAAIEGGLQIASRKLAFLLERKTEDLKSVARLAGPDRDEYMSMACSLTQHMQAALEDATKRLYGLSGAVATAPIPCSDSEGREASPKLQDEPSKVPVRTIKGPIDSRGLLASLAQEDRLHWEQYASERPSLRRIATHAVYYADGSRSIKQISDLVEMETGVRDEEALQHLFEVLHRAGFVAFNQ